MTASTSSPFDHAMMSIALAMARRGLGSTAPNPSVGAVIADEATGEVVARGWTQPGGRPHAETEAIRRAGARARGKTMYVTLEPCSHHGRTPPCADAIVAAGIGRVVAAIEDPDPRVAGRGLERLRAAGLAVERGVGAAEARWITRGHIVRVTERRPLVTLKIAAGADGSIPRGGHGAPAWVTGAEARARGHLLRAEADAILIGSGTLRDDDPELTCRLPGLGARSPVRVVLSRSGEVAQARKLLATADAAPILIVSGAADGDALVAAAAPVQGTKSLHVPVVGGRLWLPAVMEHIVAEGITRLLVEGGPTVWRSFADAHLVDEVHLFQAPGPTGREGQGGDREGHDGPDIVARAAATLSRLLGGLPLGHVETRAAGRDWHSTFRFTPRSEPRPAPAANPTRNDEPS